jgi:hypothetical protein
MQEQYKEPIPRRHLLTHFARRLGFGLGLTTAVTLLGKDIPQTIEALSHISQHLGNNDYFEGALHTTTQEESEAVMCEFTQKGNLNVHQWDKNVVERMQSYKPLVIATDSTLPGGFSHEVCCDAWTFGIPARPQVINNTDTMYLIRTDFANYGGLMQSGTTQDMFPQKAVEALNKYSATDIETSKILDIANFM